MKKENWKKTIAQGKLLLPPISEELPSLKTPAWEHMRPVAALRVRLIYGACRWLEVQKAPAEHYEMAASEITVNLQRSYPTAKTFSAKSMQRYFKRWLRKPHDYANLTH